MDRQGAFYLQAQPWARDQRNSESSRARVQPAPRISSPVQQQEMSATEREIMAYRGALFDAEENFHDSLGTGHRPEIVRSNEQRKAAALQYFSKVNFHYEQRMSHMETEAKRQNSELNHITQQNEHLKSRMAHDESARYCLGNRLDNHSTCISGLSKRVECDFDEWDDRLLQVESDKTKQDRLMTTIMHRLHAQEVANGKQQVEIVKLEETIKSLHLENKRLRDGVSNKNLEEHVGILYNRLVLLEYSVEANQETLKSPGERSSRGTTAGLLPDRGIRSVAPPCFPLFGRRSPQTSTPGPSSGVYGLSVVISSRKNEAGAEGNKDDNEDEHSTDENAEDADDEDEEEDEESNEDSGEESDRNGPSGNKDRSDGHDEDDNRPGNNPSSGSHGDVDDNTTLIASEAQDAKSDSDNKGKGAPKTDSSVDLAAPPADALKTNSANARNSGFRDAPTSDIFTPAFRDRVNRQSAIECTMRRAAVEHAFETMNANRASS